MMNIWWTMPIPRNCLVSLTLKRGVACFELFSYELANLWFAILTYMYLYFVSKMSSSEIARRIGDSRRVNY
jgi:hypothetical protein